MHHQVVQSPPIRDWSRCRSVWCRWTSWPMPKLTRVSSSFLIAPIVTTIKKDDKIDIVSRLASQETRMSKNYYVLPVKVPAEKGESFKLVSRVWTTKEFTISLSSLSHPKDKEMPMIITAALETRWFRRPKASHSPNGTPILTFLDPSVSFLQKRHQSLLII